MASVFLSYAREDHHFAELAEVKLAESKITLWRDQGQLRAGADWRQGIETAIADSLAVLVALSPRSAESSYVTFEWAYAIGKGKAVVPVLFEKCTIPSRLEPIHRLDFSVAGLSQWSLLAKRLNEIESDVELKKADKQSDVSPLPITDPRARAILKYLDECGYQMASFDRLRRRIDERLTNDDFEDIVRNNPMLFRSAKIEGSRPGLAKLIP